MLRSVQAFILVTLASSTGLIAGAMVTDIAFASGQESVRGLPLIRTVLDTIEQNWAGEPDETALMHGAATGMVESLDRHSRFLSPDDYKKVREDTDGVYFGIGVEFIATAEGARITAVLSGSPAERADLRVDDIITHVDGEDIRALSSEEFASRVRGPRDESVELGLLRDREELSKSVIRGQVLIPAVEWALVEPGLGYARIDEFQRRCGVDLKEAVADLEKEGDTPLTGMVLDLRSNPGGLVSEAIAVADIFLAGGSILEVRGKDPASSVFHSATATEDDQTFPLVILVNSKSASASEIVAGALQARGRATLVGSSTYGKGSVQKLFEFTNGSALKLTTSKYYLPDGRSIEQDHGLIPDHSVPVPSSMPAEWTGFRETLEALELDDSEHERLRQQADRIERTQIGSEAARIPLQGPIADRMLRDVQLQRAIELLREDK